MWAHAGSMGRAIPPEITSDLGPPFYASPPEQVTLHTLAGRSLCWALYTPGALHGDLAQLRCDWEAIYVYRDWGPDPVGVICSRCGDVRGL